MRTSQLKSELWLPQPRGQVFTFFADPRNLERITPAWLRFEMVTPPTIKIERGTLLDYRLRLHGIPLRWQSEITMWQPPQRFIDSQKKGPYLLWIHEHTFFETENGTTVCDRVQYAAPGGRLVERFLVAPDLERIFSYRRRILKDLFRAESRPLERNNV